MNAITKEQLSTMLTMRHADAHAAVWVDPLNDAMRVCSVSTAIRQAAFLAQVLLESGEFQQLQELLNYSPQRLRQVWPRRFADDATAIAYSHNPEKLANKVYANRMGNGNEASGDGWAFRGRGLIQLTGRSNYASFSQSTGIDALANPDLLQQPAGAALSGAWFWQSKGLNELADKSASADANAIFTELTRRINGGTNGLEQRKAYWVRARQALGVAGVH
ncbi:glycoside hydrolase family 19 protein [Janthinobacterium fluminis]|uniref:Glycoside hydrolase family 19 protein n=1 Tax=Janthinobacterium fluminis TaxID=2987524 RepID=A0ABT5JV99_9BURK|nr:glycoside hydrolase family 19 protein [Janthinobacterium fluminis]MDC8756665.1 glycoside hydrolase family 19 protein [Janthinobacterium fluminis]